MLSVQRIRGYNHFPREMVYSLAIGIITFCQLIQSSIIPYELGPAGLGVFLKYLRYLAYLLVVLCILSKPCYSKYTVYFGLLALGIGLLVAHYSGMTVLIVFLIALGMADSDYKKVAMSQFVIIAVLYFFIFIGSQIGLIDNWSFGLGSSRPRYCMGFFYPSHTTSTFFALVLLFCYIKKDSLQIWHVVLISILNYWQYHYTDCRAGSMLALAAPLVVLLIKKDPLRSRINRSYILQYAFPICAVLCLALTICYQHNAVNLEWLDKVLSTRLSRQAAAMDTYGINLFGQHIDWYGKGGAGYIVELDEALLLDNYVDSSFIKVLLDRGIIAWFLVIAGFLSASAKAAKTGDTVLLVCLSFMALYCTVEQWMLNFANNPFLILIGNMFFKYSNTNKHFAITKCS